MGSVPIELVYEQIVLFAREAGARRVVLFGSRARGTNLPKSDIDIAIEDCPNFASLEDRLQEQLWSLLKIDVVNLDGPLSESLRHEISRAYEADRTAAAGPPVASSRHQTPTMTSWSRRLGWPCRAIATTLPTCMTRMQLSG